MKFLPTDQGVWDKTWPLSSPSNYVLKIEKTVVRKIRVVCAFGVFRTKQLILLYLLLALVYFMVY